MILFLASMIVGAIVGFFLATEKVDPIDLEEIDREYHKRFR